MAFKKTFIVSTQKVNSHGFVTMTNGIRLDAAKENCPAFYDHKYWEGTVGHWQNIRVEGVNLVADFVCEGITQAEKDIIKKIEAGDIKGASIGADPITWSDDPVYLTTGQTKPTLLECELFEISVTPLPGNNQALCLKRDGQPVTLTATNVHNIIPNLKPQKNMTAIAIKLGLKSDATESEILQAIDNIRLTASNNEAVAQKVFDKVSEGLEGPAKEIFVTLTKTNAEQAIAYAESVKAPQTTASEGAASTTTLKKDVKVSDLISLGKGREKEAAEGKDCFDYLSKHDTLELNRIRLEEPDRYAKLTRDYQKGVRYNGKTA